MSLRLDLESSIERMKNAIKEFAKSIDQLEDVLAAHLDGTVRPRSPDTRPIARVPAADFKALETAISGRNQVPPTAVDKPK